ncbi:hypothetical protein HanPI659440_Chr12g0478701 [Helianthus annuus]|nr:hypothetical protein HanPI659440_Chr12g0478701 [Helianthus annuus]
MIHQHWTLFIYKKLMCNLYLFYVGVKFVINADKDKRIKFCCLQSKAAEPYMRICGVDREDVLRRFLFIEGPYEYHQGSTG